MKLTGSQHKALTVLKDTGIFNTVSAKEFAEKMWGDTDTRMFKKVSNTGNGACSGKAAWLCAGSYLAKLIKKGWVDHKFDPNGYFITQEGKKLIN